MPPPSHGHGGRGGHGGRRGRRSGGGHGGHEEGGSERWLVTYADMLTLLLVLFIVLFSISVVNTSKFISLKTSLAAAFGSGQKGIVTGGTGLLDNDADGTGQQLVMAGNPVAQPSAQSSATPTTQATGAAGVPLTTAEQNQQAAAQAAAQAAEAAQNKDYLAIESAVNDALTKNHMPGDANFTITNRGLVIRVTSDLVFPGNSAELETQGSQILAAIAPPLATETRSIEVDGYTNQLNVSTGPYASGWELSSARASAVADYLAHHGVSGTKLSAVGLSDNDPLYPPSDPRAASLNRRVEIVVLSTLPAGTAATASGTDSSTASATPSSAAQPSATPSH